MIKKYAVLPAIVLIVVLGIILLLYRFSHNDAETIQDFSSSYETFHQAVLDYSGLVFTANGNHASDQGDLESKAGQALADLQTKASRRISSVTRHDAEMMTGMRAIADLSTKEIDALAAYRKAAEDKNTNLEPLEQGFRDMASQTQAAYAHWQALAGIKD